MEHVEHGKIDIQSDKSKDQLVDILTKPLSERELVKLRDIIIVEKPDIDTTSFQASAMNTETVKKEVNSGSAIRENSALKNLTSDVLF